MGLVSDQSHGRSGRMRLELLRQGAGLGAGYERITLEALQAPVSAL
jgi:hypothetical protein